MGLWINALALLTEKGGGDDWEGGEGKSRERHHRQIETIIIKVTTIIIGSIYLAPIKYQALCIHFILSKPYKVAIEVSLVQMREPKVGEIKQFVQSIQWPSWSQSPGLSVAKAHGSSVNISCFSRLKQVARGRLRTTGGNFTLKIIKRVQTKIKETGFTLRSQRRGKKGRQESKSARSEEEAKDGWPWSRIWV